MKFLLLLTIFSIYFVAAIDDEGSGCSDDTQLGDEGPTCSDDRFFEE
jgi:hypothetical protein